MTELSEHARAGRCRVIALVHSRELAWHEGIEYIELPWSVRSWLHRLWCEYVTMHGISKRLGDIDLWLSLHDTSPRVKARSQAVYCHNPFPFFKWRWIHLLLNWRIVGFAIFSRWIYRINIHRNDFIIVQQSWLRHEFIRMFGLNEKKIVVFPPVKNKNENVNDNPNDNDEASLNSKPSTLNPKHSTLNSQLYTFLYPAWPDVHKNFECLCEAARILEQEVGDDKFEVILTTDNNANRYSRWINRKWGEVNSLHFSGFLNRNKLYEQYTMSDCLVFPSLVETWGLPISEFSAFGRPMLLADLPYAHETAAGSSLVAFFDPQNPQELAKKMKSALMQDHSLFNPVSKAAIASPFASDWSTAINIFDIGK